MGKKQMGSGSGTSRVDAVVSDVSEIIDLARRSVVRSTNATMTAAYWCIGRRIVEEEQRGLARAGYGEELLVRVSERIGNRFGRAITWRRLAEMRAFYQAYPDILRTASANLTTRLNHLYCLFWGDLGAASQAFRLPWSHYVRLIRVHSDAARRFYEERSRGDARQRSTRAARTILPPVEQLEMEMAQAKREVERRQLPAPADEPKRSRKPRGSGGGSRAGEALAPWIAAAMALH